MANARFKRMDAPTSQATADQPARLSRLAAYGTIAKQALPFIASCALIDFLLNLRYPAPEPVLWYLIPSTDVVVLCGYFAVFGWNGWRVPKAVHGLLIALLLLVRVLRFGDGIQHKIYYQNFNLYTDLSLLPELVRFSHSTLPWWKFTLVVLATLGTIALFIFATYKALTCAERYLADMKNVRYAAAGAGVLFVVSYFVPHDPFYDELWYGGFAKSVVPRMKHEVNFLLNVYGYTAERTKIIADTQERFAHTPSNLAKLHHANVHLILIESYGQAVFDQPLLEERSRASIDAFEAEITQHGFSIASGTLASPTYGGQSWLAHSTLSTGVHTTDPLGYELLSTQHPKTIARFFRDAGYRTVLVHPGTMRPWPKGEFYQFDQKYYAWMFDYAGPSYAWATMPDQFVLDFVRRTELEKRDRPLFDQVVLVTSHAPWSEQPPAVDDWSTIHNGAIFNALPVVRYPIIWPYFEEAQEAYIRSIIYDIDILKQYIARYIKDDSLVILLGDHQPVGEIAGEGEKRGVPVHVMSRDAALVEPFLSRGYVQGMRPTLVEPPPPMADFLVHLLEDFSTPDGPAP